MKLSIAECFVLVLGITSAADEWGYSGNTGPENWPDIDSNCGGSRQSPIDIVTDDVTVDENLASFDRNAFNDLLTGMEMTNNGHSLVINIGGDTYRIGGSDNLFPDTYQLAQFHLHWGTPTGLGSEHTVDGKQYFAEIHFVFYNTRYAGVSEAKTETDGLAVLGFFIEPTYPQSNCAFDRLFNFIGSGDGNVNNYNTTRPFSSDEQFSVETLLPPDISQYYRYRGSLTTPTCDENVIWTVFKSPIRISTAQAAKLGTALYTDQGTTVLRNNYRPVLPLNGRIVTMNSSSLAPVSTFLLTVFMATLSSYVK